MPCRFLSAGIRNLIQKVVVWNIQNRFQRFYLERIKMPLPHPDLCQTAPCHAAAVRLQPGGQLILRKSPFFPDRFSFTAHLFIVIKIHPATPLLRGSRPFSTGCARSGFPAMFQNRQDQFFKLPLVAAPFVRADQKGISVHRAGGDGRRALQLFLSVFGKRDPDHLFHFLAGRKYGLRMTEQVNMSDFAVVEIP
jgi:hypothetical protein